MKAKTLITSCCLFAIMACGTAFAQQGKMMSGPYKGPMGPAVAPEIPDAAPFYTNLVTNPCVTSQMYSSDNGFLVLGPNNCFLAGATQWIAYPFVASKTGTVRKVQLAVTLDNAGLGCTSTTSAFTVQIYSDACTGVPVSPLGSAATANAPAGPPSLATANFRTGAALTLGTQYWVVVTTSTAATQTGTTAVWWQTTFATQGFNLNDGNGWISAPLGGPGAFNVQ